MLDRALNASAKKRVEIMITKPKIGEVIADNIPPTSIKPRFIERNKLNPELPSNRVINIDAKNPKKPRITPNHLPKVCIKKQKVGVATNSSLALDIESILLFLFHQIWNPNHPVTKRSKRTRIIANISMPEEYLNIPSEIVTITIITGNNKFKIAKSMNSHFKGFF